MQKNNINNGDEIKKRSEKSSSLADANEIKEVAPDNFNNEENNEADKSKQEEKKEFGKSLFRGRILEKIKLAKTMNNNKKKKKNLGNLPRPQNKNTR